MTGWMSADSWLDDQEHAARSHDFPALIPPPLLTTPLTGALCSELSWYEADFVFYPIPKVTVADLARAQVMCFACPALRGCLQGSIERNERHGIWAGTSRRTRLRIRVMIATTDLTLDQVLDDFEAGHIDPYVTLPTTANEYDEA
jgi:hypothetical protein